jgi:hypothetical protein
MEENITDVMVPEWVTEIGDEIAREMHDSEQKARNSTLVNTLIKSDGSPLVRQIFKELVLQALACKKIGVQAMISDVSRKSDTEIHQQVLRVHVTASSPWSRTTYVDVSYAEGEQYIHCCARDADPFNIKLAPDERGNLVIISPNGTLLTPELAAKFILRPAVKYVLGR